MTRYLKCVPLAGLMCMAAVDSTSPDAVLQRMHDAQSKVTTLRARLEQVKSYPQLGIDDPAETGTFYLERGGAATRVRIQIDEPEVRVLTLTENGYVLYQPRIRQAVEGKLTGGGKTGMFSGILTGSAGAMQELERDYEAEGLGDARFEERAVVRLRFEARAGAEVYCRRIDLVVDTESWLPIQQTCEEANESVITFTLRDVETGEPFEKSLFELELPPGVERVRG